jgi:hypothetical protein
MVTDASGTNLATLDSQIAALVAETASNTGALFVRVIDDSGQAINGATVTATNSTVSPAVNVSDTTDVNGMAIFYDLPPSTTGYRYVVSAALAGFSSLTTLAPNGTLSPNYSSQNLLAQNSSSVTLTLRPMTSNSLVLETTDTTGNPLANARIYVKGGYKKYSNTTDTTYYYDTISPSDTRPVTDTSGQVALKNLVPGPYYFCGNSGATSCSVNGATYYLAAAVPYSGTNSLSPLFVPIYETANPPTSAFSYGGSSYVQKVRLILTSSSSFPRVSTITPDDLKLSNGSLSNVGFVITGTNLPCSSTAASCTTKVSFTQNAATYQATCTGSASGVQLNCTANFSGVVQGNLQMTIKVGSNTLTLPDTPLLGGILVSP